MYSSKRFNFDYIQFVGYETCQKLICTPCDSCRNTNKIRKQGIPKSNINKTFPSSKLGFGCYPHKDTCDILSELLFSCILQ